MADLKEFMAKREYSLENMEIVYKINNKCSLCYSKNLSEILYLGKTPIANTYLAVGPSDIKKDSQFYDDKIPLTLLFCNDCSLVQLKEFVSPEKLFTDKEYLYYSSFSQTTLNHAESFVNLIINKNLINKVGKTELAESTVVSAAPTDVMRDSLIVEVASNDGYLLKFFKEKGFKVLGIEPAKNVAKIAKESCNIPTIEEFFSNNLARKLLSEGIAADIIIANNVIAHIPDINDFVSGLYTILKNEGVAIIEIPYFKIMIENLFFDMIYHEHMYYYTFTTLHKLFSKNGFYVQKVEQTPIQGGSLRVYATKIPDSKFFQTADKEYTEYLLESEKKEKINNKEYYQVFATKLFEFKDKIKKELLRITSGSKKIAGYGAAAKAFTFLSFCEIDDSIIDFIVDKNTYKQGKFMPVFNIPIYSPDELLNKLPQYTLLLAWNYVDEVIKEQKEYLKKGGSIIVPLPEFKIINE